MSEERAKRIHKVYGIALSLVLLAAAICLIAACIGIYRSGDKPFSREAVAAAFVPIRIPVYLCLAMVVIGFVLKLIFPMSKEKLPTQKLLVPVWKQLCQKADLEGCAPDLKQAVLHQRKQRDTLNLITLVCTAVCAAVFLCYGLNPGNFHSSEINASMVKAMWILIPCLSIPFGLGIFRSYACRASLEKEIALLKKAPRGGTAPTEAPQKDNKANILKTAVLLAAVAILLFGFFTGGALDVLTKAINICTECVGLG